MLSRNLWKRVGIGVALLLVVCLAIMVVRTLNATSHQARFAPFANNEWQQNFTQAYRSEVFETRLSQAIQFPTISFRPEDKVERPEEYANSINAFRGWQLYLETEYSEVFTKLSLEKINEHSLILHWPGARNDRRPILLIAHQDVVPAPTKTTPWKEDPFGGKIDEEFIWGRGTLDDKASIIAILNTVEWLLASGFTPDRDIYFAFGHDEEIGGENGAAAMAKYFADKELEFAFVLDEGGVLYPGSGFGIDQDIALIGIAEKGFANLSVSVDSPGGHSSMPPKQTAIGELSAAIDEFDCHGFPASVSGVFEQMLDTLAPEMNFAYRLLMRNRWITSSLLKRVFAAKNSTNAFLRTSHAFTIIHGGTAANVLPNSVEATLNLRLLPGDTYESARDYVEAKISNPKVKVAVKGKAVNPSLVSDPKTNEFSYVASVARTSFSKAVVTPYLVIGGTDARHYQSVSQNLYRFLPIYLDPDLLATMHGVDEKISRRGFRGMHEFYLNLFTQLSKLD